MRSSPKFHSYNDIEKGNEKKKLKKMTELAKPSLIDATVTVNSSLIASKINNIATKNKTDNQQSPLLTSNKSLPIKLIKTTSFITPLPITSSSLRLAFKVRVFSIFFLIPSKFLKNYF